MGLQAQIHILSCRSCSIGDWYPERNIFQVLIAITSGPRFALVFLQYFITRTSHSTLPNWVFLTGLVRTLACGGWVYITSTDDHDAHDVLMVLYIVCNLPWMVGGIMNTPTNHVQVRKKRFVSCLPLVSPSSTSFLQAICRCSVRILANRRPLLLTPILSFFASIIPLVYFFIEHKVHRIPGGKLVFPCHRTKLTLP